MPGLVGFPFEDLSGVEGTSWANPLSLPVWVKIGRDSVL